MKSYASTTMPKISYFPLPNSELVDIYLRKELPQETGSEGEVLIVYDEVYLRTNKSLTRSQVEENFEALFSQSEVEPLKGEMGLRALRVSSLSLSSLGEDFTTATVQRDAPPLDILLTKASLYFVANKSNTTFDFNDFSFYKAELTIEDFHTLPAPEDNVPNPENYLWRPLYRAFSSSVDGNEGFNRIYPYEVPVNGYHKGDIWYWDGKLGILNPDNRPRVISGLGDELSIKNEIVNGDFSQGKTWWNLWGNASLGTPFFTIQDNKLLLNGISNGNGRLSQDIIANLNDKFYLSYRTDGDNSSQKLIFALSDYNTELNLKTLNYITGGGLKSIEYTNDRLGGYRLSIAYSLGEYTNRTIDDIVCINRTKTFGVGNEPTKEEMDELLTLTGWFDGTVTVPRYFIATKDNDTFDFNDFELYTGEFKAPTNVGFAEWDSDNPEDYVWQITS